MSSIEKWRQRATQDKTEEVRVLADHAGQLTRWPERTELQPVKVELAALGQLEGLHAGREGRPAEATIGRPVDDPFDLQGAEQLGQVARVVGLVMADHDRGKLLDTQLPEPILDAILGWTGVDEHRIPIRRL